MITSFENKEKLKSTSKNHSQAKNILYSIWEIFNQEIAKITKTDVAK